MPLSLSCPHCGKTGNVPDKGIGAQVKCPRCHKLFLAIRRAAAATLSGPPNGEPMAPVQVNSPPITEDKSETLVVSPPQSYSWRTIIFVWLSAGILFLVVYSLRDPEKKPKTNPGDQLAEFLEKYDAPDFVESTENDVPRPPIPTKILVYKRENIRVVFGANAFDGSPPPYKWKIVGAVTDNTRDPIEPTEVARILAPRKK